MVLLETFSREESPYVALRPSCAFPVRSHPSYSQALPSTNNTYPFHDIQLQMDDLPLQSQQQFNYNNSPPGEDKAASEDTRMWTNNGAEKANFGNDVSIWGTQPPLDPSLLDIAKIASLTRNRPGS